MTTIPLYRHAPLAQRPVGTQRSKEGLFGWHQSPAPPCAVKSIEQVSGTSMGTYALPSSIVK